jgi:hypothetical protein
VAIVSRYVTSRRQAVQWVMRSLRRVSARIADAV